MVCNPAVTAEQTNGPLTEHEGQGNVQLTRSLVTIVLVIYLQSMILLEVLAAACAAPLPLPRPPLPLPLPLPRPVALVDVFTASVLLCFPEK